MEKNKQNIYFVLQSLQSLAALTDTESVQIAALAMRITQKLPPAASVAFAWSGVHSVELACRAVEFADRGKIVGITPEGVVDILCEQEETAQYLVKIATLPMEKFSKVVMTAFKIYQERSSQQILSTCYGEMLRNFVKQI